MGALNSVPHYAAWSPFFQHLILSREYSSSFFLLEISRRHTGIFVIGLRKVYTSQDNGGPLLNPPGYNIAERCSRSFRRGALSWAHPWWQQTLPDIYICILEEIPQVVYTCWYTVELLYIHFHMYIYLIYIHSYTYIYYIHLWTLEEIFWGLLLAYSG